MLIWYTYVHTLHTVKDLSTSKQPRELKTIIVPLKLTNMHVNLLIRVIKHDFALYEMVR